ncbi:DUF6233 domain-containing protein [Streptomyces sp. TX20-6-3]|uniref:DUF6233 domain-containing protein n=1 Tax=Streptomyces sp. TX20-6-3 TaxID=3028705 RepID=UPI0029B61E26|nr:DUF6233 domain-containing protein [Streptomyces sp. TX20-6-3]MDX2565175.1 DUF6233 domain-containing protein [Streptomyces sp. TX20-6-3]
MDQGETQGASGPPPILVVLPDGQEIRGRLHARRQQPDGWRYQIGIQLWQDHANGLAEAAEHRAWVSPAQARPIPGVSYGNVPTHRPSTENNLPPRNRPAWTLQYLPHRPGHPGATLLHVIGCIPSDHTLDREQALTALHQPRAAACTECDAARSLTSASEHPPGEGSAR